MPVSPTNVVRGLFDAYNERDIETFLDYFHDDAAVYGPDGEVMERGREAMRATFSDIFTRMPELHADTLAEMEVGDWVAIHSRVPEWKTADGSTREMQWIEVYRVVDGKVTELRLYR